ncbi:hypothetical protein DPMN_020350 [Dreissena polymorpha]|uniref:Uncharacterized protein n=1 Tax=Dreissena polymorpha TaxID=45954 RepID=A0A9D4SAZ3_DREPO|nr:hypothetical protein DPMN_020350 [Dreissena polymorpha]
MLDQRRIEKVVRDRRKRMLRRNRRQKLNTHPGKYAALTKTVQNNDLSCSKRPSKHRNRFHNGAAVQHQQADHKNVS